MCVQLDRLRDAVNSYLVRVEAGLKNPDLGRHDTSLLSHHIHSIHPLPNILDRSPSRCHLALSVTLIMPANHLSIAESDSEIAGNEERPESTTKRLNLVPGHTKDLKAIITLMQVPKADSHSKFPKLYVFSCLNDAKLQNTSTRRTTA